MSKINSKQRRHEIGLLVQKQGEVTVDELVRRFATSEVTIRKDLSVLEVSGVLLRRYGGAMRIPNEGIEDINENSFSKRKVAIAKAAAELIRDHNRIIIDSGSTTAALIQQLDSKQGLVVMTNSLNVANELTSLEREPTVLMTGGTWDTQSEAFQGQVAEKALRSYDFDQLFIGADGIDISRGTTTFNELVGLSQVMAEVSREVIVMVESQKISRKMPNLELQWEQIDTLITDDQLQDEITDSLRKTGINLIVVTNY